MSQPAVPPAPTPLRLWPGAAPVATHSTTPEALADQRFLEQPTLVPYLLPPSPQPRAMMLVCPGGGYGRRAAHEGEPVALWLNSLGLHAAVVHYRVWPHHHPTPLGDASRAMRVVRHHATAWGVDPQRVGILGFSAGGHLAASVCCLAGEGDASSDDPVEQYSAKPNAGILCYAVLSFGEHRHDGSRKGLLGPAYGDEVLAKALSLETRISSAHPPCFLWSTSDDPTVSVTNSLLYAAGLRAAGVPFALHVYPQGKHGLGLAADHPAGAWTSACAAWLRELGWAAPRNG